jgi:class 3 adenylate cyclase
VSRCPGGATATGIDKTAAVPGVEVHYAVSDGASLAYEVFGSGPTDVLLFQNSGPIDLLWELPQLASFLGQLGECARVIAFDARGTGASDPIVESYGPTLEAMYDDLNAVLDAVGSDRATILGLNSGAAWAPIAALDPQRFRSLIFSHPKASYPELRGLTLDQRRRLARGLASVRSLRSENPRVAHDPVLQEWWVRSRRLLNSPASQARNMEFAAEIDVTSILGSVRVPTLIFHRRDNRVWNIEGTRDFADRVPGSRLVELEGSEVDLFLGDTVPVLTEIERFLREDHPEPSDDRPLATVLFTDFVSSTEQLAAMGDAAWRHLLDEHDTLVERLVTAHGGRVVRGTGDGTLATFGGPARALRCAAAVRDGVAELGLVVRVGLHTGEIEVREVDLAGIAVVIAKRITDLAGPRQILVSRTVVDLSAGSGVGFEPLGEHALKGVPGATAVFDARI